MYPWNAILKKRGTTIFVHRKRKSCSCLSSPETPSWTVAHRYILDHIAECCAYSTVHLTFHPLHWLSSGYFEKLRAFCTQRTHFGSLPAISRVLTYIDVHGPDSDVLICTFAAKKFGSCLLKPWAETRRILFFNDLPAECCACSTVHLTSLWRMSFQSLYSAFPVFNSRPAISRVFTYIHIDVHRPDSDALIFHPQHLTFLT